MKKLVFTMMMFFVTTGLAWGQNDFESITKRVFSSSIINSVEMNKGVGKIIFKDLPNNPTYFRSGDKINKIFAIESARLFRDVSELNSLKMIIPWKEKTYSMNISRKTIEAFYGLDFLAMKGNSDNWRNNFIQKYDSKKSRAIFVSKFVTSK